jgi:ribosomal protein L9
MSLDIRIGYATDDNKKLHEELMATNALAKARLANKGSAVSKAERANALAELFQELQVQIAALPEDWCVNVAANATADGRLYAAIASTDLVIALKDQQNIDCPLSAVLITETKRVLPMLSSSVGTSLSQALLKVFLKPWLCQKAPSLDLWAQVPPALPRILAWAHRQT